jgi:hypothetical protein
VSITATWNNALTEEPALSTALQMTVVVPSGNAVPEAGSHEGTSGPSTTSDAAGGGA